MRNLIYGARFIFLIIRFVFRFVSGRPLSGDRKTDATFTRPATHSLDPSRTALRWEMMRGASRMAWRMGGLYLFFLGGLLILLKLSSILIRLPWYLRPSSILWMHLGGILLTGGSYFLRRRMRDWGYSLPVIVRMEGGTEGTDGGDSEEELPSEKLRLQWRKVEGRKAWEQEKVLPLARSSSIILGVHIPDRKATEWVTVPKDYREPGGHPVILRLPPSFTGADEGVKKRLTSSVGQKLGMKTVSSVWQMEGSSPQALFSSPPEPPGNITFTDVEDFLRRTEEFRPLLGLVGGGQALHAEMVADSPHIGISAGPGAGKSTLAKLIIMQVLYWGWGVVVLDWKMTNAYAWLKDLPGVTYLSDIETIHEMGERIAQEVDLRKSGGMTGRANVLVVRDEWNVTADLLMAWWQDLRATEDDPEVKRVMPLKSPALRGYAVLDYAGREFGLFDLCIAQRFSARAFNGNADIRECFQIKCLARYSEQTRKMLAGDIKPFPKKSNTPGRWTIVAGDDVAVAQAPLIGNEEAREFALGGVPNPITPFTSSYGTSFAKQGDVDRTQGNQLGAGSAPPSEDLPVLEGEEVTSVDARKLTDMVSGLEPLGITLDILRHATKDPENGFPLPFGGSPNKGYTYDYQMVREWARKRHASQLTERRARG